MGFYSTVIFPRLCNLALDSPHVAKHRQALLEPVGGAILEIGFGTGLNLPYYPKQVRAVTVVDSNEGMFRHAARRLRQSPIDVEQCVLNGESLPFADGTFDWVVSTFTLCSIENVSRAISEVFRVLRTGGRFLFLEHGLSPDPAVQKWQRRMNWLEQRLAAGCRLDRDIRSLVAAQPFASVTAEEFYLERTPKTHGYMYRGQALR